MSHEAMKMALDALTYIYSETNEVEDELIDKAIKALSVALDTPEPEPVGWFGYSPAHDAWFHTNEGEDDSIPLYRRPPPAAQWVGLTDEEIEIIEAKKAPPVDPDFVNCDDWFDFARAIEQALKEKNGG